VQQQQHTLSTLYQHLNCSNCALFIRCWRRDAKSAQRKEIKRVSFHIGACILRSTHSHNRDFIRSLLLAQRAKSLHHFHIKAPLKESCRAAVSLSQYYSISTHSNNNLSRCSLEMGCWLEQQNGKSKKHRGVTLRLSLAQSKNCHCETAASNFSHSSFFATP